MPILGGQTLAASKPAITISPFLSEVKFSSSDATKDFDVNITNNSTNTKDFTLSVLDFGSLNESGGVVFAGSNVNKLINKYGLAHWLQLSTNDVSIEPGKTATITATIINNENLQPGGHYTAIVAALTNPDPTRMNEISINQKLSSLILATKVGGEKYDLKLQQIEAKGSLFHLPKSVTLHFNNPGNVHVIPRGTVRIVSPSGKVVSRGVINEDSSYILPETSRQLSVDLTSIGFRSLWPTLYHVEINYRYEGVDQFAHKSQRLYFVNVPGIIGLGFVLYTFVWVVLRNWHRIKLLYKSLLVKIRKVRLK